MGDPIAAYRERMYAVGKGSALWHPSPRKFDQHDQPQPHVRVGDVGYIDRGQWTLLFNVHAELPGALIRNPSRQPLEKPGTRIHVSTRELPPGLGHWSVAGDSSSGVGTRLSSHGVAAKGPIFKFAFDSQATLHYFGEAEEQEVATHSQGHYAKYFYQNRNVWQAALKRNGIGIDVDSLIVVTSCTRCSAWANSVRFGASSHLELGVTAHLSSLATIELVFDKAEHVHVDVSYNSGPTKHAGKRPNSEASTPPLDQCLFLSTWKISRVKKSWLGITSYFPQRQRIQSSSSSSPGGWSSPDRGPGNFESATNISDATRDRTVRRARRRQQDARPPQVGRSYPESPASLQAHFAPPQEATGGDLDEDDESEDDVDISDDDDLPYDLSGSSDDSGDDAPAPSAPGPAHGDDSGRAPDEPKGSSEDRDTDADGSPRSPDDGPGLADDLDDSASATSDIPDFDMLSMTLDRDWKDDALRYIGENSDADLALVHDDHLLEFAGEIDEEKGIYEILRKRRPHIYVHCTDDGTLGALCRIPIIDPAPQVIEVNVLVEIDDGPSDDLHREAAAFSSAQGLSNTFLIFVSGSPDLLKVVEQAVSKANTVPGTHGARPHRPIAITPTLGGGPELLLVGDDASVSFLHEDVQLRTLGLSRVSITVPRNPVSILPILRAAAHYFWSLRLLPSTRDLCSKVDAAVYSQENPSKDASRRPLVARQVLLDFPAFFVTAAAASLDHFAPLMEHSSSVDSGDQAREAEKGKHYIKLVNNSGRHLYAWGLHFDSSTLEIKSLSAANYYEGVDTQPWTTRGRGSLLLAGSTATFEVNFQLKSAQSANVSVLRFILAPEPLGLSDVEQTAPYLHPEQSPSWPRKMPAVWDAVTLTFVQKLDVQEAQRRTRGRSTSEPLGTPPPPPLPIFPSSPSPTQSRTIRRYSSRSSVLSSHSSIHSSHASPR